MLEELRLSGDLFEGTRLPEGGLLRIEKNFVHVELPPDLPEDKADNRILMVCRGLQEQNPEEQVVLVTKDLVLRIKADILGIKAEDFTTEQVSPDDALYTGRAEVLSAGGAGEGIQKKRIPSEAVYQTDESGERKKPELTENEFLVLRLDQSSKKTLLGRVEGNRIVPLVYKKSRPYGVSPRNGGTVFYPGRP